MDTIVVFDPAPGPASSVDLDIVHVEFLDTFVNTTVNTSSISFGAGDKVFVILRYLPATNRATDYASNIDVAGSTASIMQYDPGGGTQDAFTIANGLVYEVWEATVSGTPTDDVSITGVGELGVAAVTIARASGLTTITDLQANGGGGFSGASTSFSITSGGRSFGMAQIADTSQPSSISGSVDSYTNAAGDFVSGSIMATAVTADHSSTTTETVTMTFGTEATRYLFMVSLE